MLMENYKQQMIRDFYDYDISGDEMLWPVMTRMAKKFHDRTLQEAFVSVRKNTKIEVVSGVNEESFKGFDLDDVLCGITNYEDPRATLRLAHELERIATKLRATVKAEDLV